MAASLDQMCYDCLTYAYVPGGPCSRTVCGTVHVASYAASSISDGTHQLSAADPRQRFCSPALMLFI